MKAIEKDEFLLARQYILMDINRELELAIASADPGKEDQLKALGVTTGGGNFLAALAILCYTEFGGGIITGEEKCRGNFDAFLREMGADYGTILDSGMNVYNLFRCGMAHEYFAKKSMDVSMFGAPTTGLGEKPNGQLFFCLQKYFEDFMIAFDNLGKRLGYI